MIRFIRNILFQFTPLREGRPKVFGGRSDAGAISIHAPAGGATFGKSNRDSARRISIHAPAGGATPMAAAIASSPAISIHAPAGGATLGIGAEGLRPAISIHAPAGGATVTPTWPNCRPSYFNSRPCGRGDGGSRSGHHHQDSISIHAPAGGATKPMPRLVDWQQISIHAPAGGATDKLCMLPFNTTNFNSRPCGRGDPPAAPGGRSGSRFQFTPLREGRR